MNLIDLQHISVSLKGKTILQDVSLSLATKDFVTVIGPNGAGKSTLLKVVVGLLHPTTGSFHKGEGVRFGYMPQRLLLNEMMPISVVDFLKTARAGGKRRDVIQEMDLTRLLDTSMHGLSGGEFQRVLLARALLNDPTLLILDEPTQGLDVAGQNHFYQLLDRLRAKTELAILMVSHDLHFVHRASQQVICLNQHVCCAGQPSQVQKSKEYQALFPDYAGSEVLPYVHEHDHDHN